MYQFCIITLMLLVRDNELKMHYWSISFTFILFMISIYWLLGSWLAMAGSRGHLKHHPVIYGTDHPWPLRCGHNCLVNHVTPNSWLSNFALCLCCVLSLVVLWLVTAIMLFFIDCRSYVFDLWKNRTYRMKTVMKPRSPPKLCMPQPIASNSNLQHNAS